MKNHNRHHQIQRLSFQIKLSAYMQYYKQNQNGIHKRQNLQPLDPNFSSVSKEADQPHPKRADRMVQRGMKKLIDLPGIKIRQAFIGKKVKNVTQMSGKNSFFGRCRTQIILSGLNHRRRQNIIQTQQAPRKKQDFQFYLVSCLFLHGIPSPCLHSRYSFYP